MLHRINNVQPVRLAEIWLAGFLWEKNTAEWLTDLADNLKRTGWLCLLIILD
jgi:hypothetical protein